MNKTQKTVTKRRPDGKFAKGHRPATMFKPGNPGGPGRPKSWIKYAQEEISRIEGLDPGSDEYLRAMANLQWKYAKEGKYEALRDLVDRQFGKIPDLKVQIEMHRVEIVQYFATLIPRAFKLAGIAPEKIKEGLINLRRMVEADNKES